MTYSGNRRPSWIRDSFSASRIRESDNDFERTQRRLFKWETHQTIYQIEALKKFYPLKQRNKRSEERRRIYEHQKTKEFQNMASSGSNMATAG